MAAKCDKQDNTCRNCSGSHSAKDCPINSPSELKCANCGGAHASNNPACPVIRVASEQNKVKAMLLSHTLQAPARISESGQLAIALARVLSILLVDRDSTKPITTEEVCKVAAIAVSQTYKVTIPVDFVHEVTKQTTSYSYSEAVKGKGPLEKTKQYRTLKIGNNCVEQGTSIGVIKAPRSNTPINLIDMSEPSTPALVSARNINPDTISALNSHIRSSNSYFNLAPEAGQLKTSSETAILQLIDPSSVVTTQTSSSPPISLPPLPQWADSSSLSPGLLALIDIAQQSGIALIDTQDNSNNATN